MKQVPVNVTNLILVDEVFKRDTQDRSIGSFLGWLVGTLFLNKVNNKYNEKVTKIVIITPNGSIYICKEEREEVEMLMLFR